MSRAAEQRDEIAAPHGRPSSGLGPHISTPLCKTAAVHHSKNCALMSQTGHPRSRPSKFTAMRVRFAPKATIRSSSRDRSRCAKTGLVQCSKQHLYSIVSSARPSSGNGMETPSALAVLRLMTISIFVTCCTGKSAGLLPLRMRPV
jgi:hypothetical protein